jgi:chromosome segregation ATPase
MKRALSVAMVTALTLLTFLFVARAQEVGVSSIQGKLEQELAAMESAFGSVQNFMGELITEVKANMSDIEATNAKISDLRNIVSAVSVEIKQAEGKMIGLRTDVDALGAGHQELRARVNALEGGLTDLASFCDLLKSRLDVDESDLGTLRGEFDALVDAYGAHMKEYSDFRQGLDTKLSTMDAGYLSRFDALESGFAGALDSLKTEVYAGLDAIQSGVYGELDALRSSLSTDIATMDSTFTSNLTLLESEYGGLSGRIQSLEDEDVGSFKKKVLELERSMAALAIKVDNNRAKLEGFDQAIATLSADMTTTKDGILQANKELLGQYEVRLQAVEDSVASSAAYTKTQIDTLYFISIVALLAGVGALIWGFLGTSS